MKETKLSELSLADLIALVNYLNQHTTNIEKINALHSEIGIRISKINFYE